MYRIAYKSLARALAPAFALALAPAFARAQGILSSEISISRDRAEIKFETDDHRKFTFATAGGASGLSRGGSSGYDNYVLGVTRGDAVDRSWRDLLNRAIDAQSNDLPTLLRDWVSPGSAGSEFDHDLDAALSNAVVAPAVTPAQAAQAAQATPAASDLRDSIDHLKEEVEEARRDAIEASRRHRGPDWLAPVRNVTRGLTGIFATLMTYAVLFGIGFVTIMLGGRKYIEGVADTVSAGYGRSFLVGLAGTFLLLPVWVMGMIALAISIVGIPALLVWVPLFPVASAGAALLGFLGVAHATGERWAERNHEGAQWISRANSYYFMAAGLALLASLFVAANIVRMAGPWLGFIHGTLNFLGVMLTWFACTTGFGAVLISRGGSRVNGTAVGSAEDASV